VNNTKSLTIVSTTIHGYDLSDAPDHPEDRHSSNSSRSVTFHSAAFPPLIARSDAGPFSTALSGFLVASGFYCGSFACSDHQQRPIKSTGHTVYCEGRGRCSFLALCFPLDGAPTADCGYDDNRVHIVSDVAHSVLFLCLVPGVALKQ